MLIVFMRVAMVGVVPLLVFAGAADTACTLGRSRVFFFGRVVVIVVILDVFRAAKVGGTESVGLSTVLGLPLDDAINVGGRVLVELSPMIWAFFEDDDRYVDTTQYAELVCLLK